MKKYLALLFIIASPLIGQETEKQDNKKDLYIEMGIFTRIEGLTSIDAIFPYPSGAAVIPISLTALEFSIGKEKIYFYSQLRFSTALPYWDYFDITDFHDIVYAQRLGFLVGIGGRIYDSNPTSDSKKFTMHMNFGVGGDFALNKHIVFNKVKIVPRPYYTIELNWMMKYYINKKFGIQWGLDLAISGTDLTISTSIGSPTDTFSYAEANIRYGFSVGFVF